MAKAKKKKSPAKRLARAKKAPKRILPDISKMRGVANFYYDNTLVLVKADVESVARELHAVRKGKKWDKEALDKPVTLSSQCFIVFRLRGHTWSEIVARD